jgi:hypothetical protein
LPQITVSYEWQLNPLSLAGRNMLGIRMFCIDTVEFVLFVPKLLGFVGAGC